MPSMYESPNTRSRTSFRSGLSGTRATPESTAKPWTGASLDAGRQLQVLRALGAPSDHPVSIDHPEGDYLHGLLLRA